MQGENRTIKISETLYKSIKIYAENSGFDSVEEFVDFVLDEVVKREAMKEKKLTVDEQKAVDKNLKELGYIKE